MSLLSADSTLAFFPNDYFDARNRFLTLARQRSAHLTNYPIRARGPAGAALSIDIAYLGAAVPRRLLILISGTHGVEGFAGSALQQQWLANTSEGKIPADAGCLLIHALNPYGFAWQRRANENNVDLNRNALAQFPGPPNAGYRRLETWLNPPSSPRHFDLFLLKGTALIARHGFATLHQSIVEGQYEYPCGLFYGGTQTEESLKVLFRVLTDSRWNQMERAVVLDIHTGVGHFATYKLMVDTEERSPGYGQLRRWFGAETIVSNRPADSLAYRVNGGLTERITSLLGADRSYAAVLEFGTVSATRILATLRGENRAFHYTPPDSPARRKARNKMQKAFCPHDPAWRRFVLTHGERVLEQAYHACFD